MKYTTTLGKELELSPIPLTNREGFTACREVLNRAQVFEGKDQGGDDWHDARFAMHDAFFVLCDAVDIDRGAVGEGDIVNILCALQTGELPGKEEAAK